MIPLREITAVNGQVYAFSGPDQAPRATLPRTSRHLLEALRKKIARIEHKDPQFNADNASPSMTCHQHAPWCFDLAEIDQHLPGHQLGTGAVHEIAGANYGEMPAAMGFAVALTIRLLGSRPHDPRPVLWCRQSSEASEFGQLYVNGLETLGLARDRLLTVSLSKSRTLLWTVEEALKSGTLAAIIADMDAAVCDLTATRRLTLAAGQINTPVLLVAGKPVAQTSSARTRWQVSAAPSIPPPFDKTAPGLPAWNIELSRCRGGKPGKWSMVWHHATYSFSLASTLSHRAVDLRSQTGPIAIAL